MCHTWQRLRPLAYIDDILIYSPVKESHVTHIRQVLEKLRKKQLYVNGEKYEFHESTISFLGYVISAMGVGMDEGKLAAVRNLPVPRTVKKLQCFLDFANFCHRFIRNFSLIAAPPMSLLKGGTRKIMWSSVGDSISESQTGIQLSAHA